MMPERGKMICLFSWPIGKSESPKRKKKETFDIALAKFK